MSAENGIWMCAKHGKIIDTDEVRFSTAMLSRWKQVAELRARISLEIGRQIEIGSDTKLSADLIEESVSIEEIGNENDLIGNLLIDCSIGSTWGNDLMDALRDLLIEVTRNACMHGLATQVVITVNPRRLAIRSNGQIFDPRALTKASGGKGGATTMEYFLQNHSAQLLLNFSEQDNELTFAFPSSSGELEALTPCTLRISREVTRHGGPTIETFADCEAVYVVLPYFFSPSDFWWLDEPISRLRAKGQRIVIVTEGVSKLVLTLLLKTYPDCKHMDLGPQ